MSKHGIDGVRSPESGLCRRAIMLISLPAIYMAKEVYPENLGLDTKAGEREIGESSTGFGRREI